jgi:bis(5'-adenosyl)-triphosphatase
VESALELSDEELAELIIFVRKTTLLLCRAYETESFDWALQNGPAAGQSERHLHFHILPRTEGDLSSPDAWLKAIPGFLEGIDGGARQRLSEEDQMNMSRWLAGFAQDS